MWQYIECPKCKYYESNCKNRIGTTAHTCFGFDEKMANEEWLRSATTEQLTIFLARQKCDGCSDNPYDEKHGTCKYCMAKKTEQIREWLKQPHREVGK